MIGNLGDSFSQQLKTLTKLAKSKKDIIESKIDHDAMSSLQRAIRLEALINLTNYSATGSKPRDTRITDAFDVLADFVGFEYNKTGSFLWAGARDAWTKDITVSSTKLKLGYTIEGKLEELEDGRVNWKNLKRFFYNPGIKAAIKLIYYTTWKDMYSRLDSLFKTTKDPTEPKGRPYIKQAMEEGSDYLHTSIKQIVHESFNRKGRWRDVLGRYA